MEEYREELGLSLDQEWGEQTKGNVESWAFGKLSEEEREKAEERTNAAQAYAFKDYVLLQTLSSRLRSALAEDIASRRRPLEGPRRTR
jgi:hypothetical protein